MLRLFFARPAVAGGDGPDPSPGRAIPIDSARAS